MSDKITAFEQELLTLVDSQKLMSYDEGIAQYIRNSGSAEELQAFKFIEQALKAEGIATELNFTDGYVSLPLEAELVVNGNTYPCLTHSMSTSVTSLKAELFYVGKGKETDYVGNDVRGKVVVVEGLAMGLPITLAQKQGALGAIFLNDAHIHNMIGSCIWGSPSCEDIATLPEIPFLSINSESAEKLRDLLAKGAAQAVITTKVDTHWCKLPVLTGTILGVENPDKYLLMSNHVDSWIYGAMDNGTANAALMHVVGILNKHKDKLKRSIKICFWSGHSHGRYAGSTAYCDAHYEDLYDNCFLHINADSLGGRGSDILTEANAMAETKNIAVPIVKELCQQDFNGSRYGRAGDQSFWGTGTPSLFMGLSEQPLDGGTAAKSFAELMGNGKTGGFGWWWHTSEDTVDKIDPEALVRDCKVYLLACFRACSDEYLPIDESKAAKEICSILKNYAAKVGDKVELNILLERADELATLTSRLEEKKNKIPPKTYNDYVMAMSRILVPLNYVEGNQFEHDAAIRGKDMPLLSVLDNYENVIRDSDAWRLINVVAQRRINAAAFALRRGINLVTKYL